MAKITPKDMKSLPELKRCTCGDIGITLRPRGGKRIKPWRVVCLNPKCDRAVRGFDNPWDAITAWNEEVMKA